MRYLQSKIIIAGLLATTSTFAYAQGGAWPEYHEGVAIDGTPTARPHGACERKLIGSKSLWECDPTARGNPFRPSAAPSSGGGPALANAGGVQYYNAVSSTGRRTRAPSRDCILGQYDSGMLWACPPRATASIGSPASTPQGAAAGNVQYYEAVSANGRRTRAPNAACTLIQQGGSQYWMCPPLTTGALSSGGAPNSSGSDRNGGEGSSGGAGNASSDSSAGNSNSGGSSGGGSRGGGGRGQSCGRRR